MVSDLASYCRCAEAIPASWPVIPDQRSARLKQSDTASPRRRSRRASSRIRARAYWTGLLRNSTTKRDTRRSVGAPRHQLPVRGSVEGAGQAHLHRVRRRQTTMGGSPRVGCRPLSGSMGSDARCARALAATRSPAPGASQRPQPALRSPGRHATAASGNGELLRTTGYCDPRLSGQWSSSPSHPKMAGRRPLADQIAPWAQPPGRAGYLPSTFLTASKRAVPSLMVGTSHPPSSDSFHA